jgi:hypothetical protein
MVLLSTLRSKARQQETDACVVKKLTTAKLRTNLRTTAMLVMKTNLRMLVYVVIVFRKVH